MLGELFTRSVTALQVAFERRKERDGPETSAPVPQLVELENRLLMSASPLAEIFNNADAVNATEGVHDAGNLEWPTQDEDLSASDGTQAVLADLETHETPRVAPTPPSVHDAAPPLELVVVDGAIAETESLLADLQATGKRYQIHHLDTNQDGVQQITELLAQTHEVDALHILSHGTAGAVRLGNNWLSDANLESHARELLTWADHLSSDADILFYGCRLADSEAGQALAHGVAVLTGADVAASTNLTGGNHLGGDWILEHHAGAIETEAAFATLDSHRWDGLLATLTVNTNADYNSSDARWGDTSSINALLSDSGSDGLISLREAIVAANQTANQTEPDVIAFHLPGTGLQTIAIVDQALPAISDAVTLDATTQPNFTGAPLIALDGSAAGTGADGLRLVSGSDGSILRGLVIHGFDNHGVAITESGGNVIAGNIIGTHADGLSSVGNRGDGIALTHASNNMLGGSSISDRNIISGQEGVGISLAGASTTNNFIQGNLIGSVGAGTPNLGNAGGGITLLHEASDNTIGGRNPGEANVIAYNASHGITIESGTGNALLANKLYGNSGLPIDLGGDGITPNDSEDTDVGANLLQNSPVIQSASLFVDTLQVYSQFHGTPNSTFDIDFYASSLTNTEGYGDAERHIGTVFGVSTDAAGELSLHRVFTDANVSAGEQITAIATDASGNSSELSLSTTANSIFDFQLQTTTSVNENQTNVPLPMIIASLTDLNLSELCIAGSGADDALFTFDGTNALTFLTSPDFENPHDANFDNVYEVHLVNHTFPANPFFYSVSVAVTPMNDNNPVFTSPTAGAVVENQTFVQTLAATDADLPAESISFALAGTGPDDQRFTIDDSHRLLFLDPPDFATPSDLNQDNIYEVDILATDGNGGTTVQSHSFTVTSANEHNPVFTSSTVHRLFDGQSTITTLTFDNEGSPPQTITTTIAGTGPDDHLFTVTSEHQLQLFSPADSTNPTDADMDNLYEVHVLASNDLGGSTHQVIQVYVMPETILVTTTNDEHDGDTTDTWTLLANPGGNGISLREALIAVNNTTGAPVATKVELPAGLYQLDRGFGDDTAHQGDLDITNDVMLIGEGARETVIDGNYLDAVFDIHTGSTTTMTGLTIQKGQSMQGGLLVRHAATLNLAEVAVRDNIGDEHGGGATVHGTLNLNRVTIQDNTAPQGGGIYFQNASPSTLTNVTISGNTASSGHGGAIWSDGSLTITHSTIANNTGSVTGGIHLSASGDVLLQSSLLGNNGPNANTALTSGDFNIDNDGTALLAGAHDRVVDQLLLNPLGNYGGPTNTHAPLATSAALDPVGLASTTTVDQRGIPRGPRPDIGAFEGSVGDPVSTILDADSQPNTISESSAVGTEVGITAFATDPDDNSSIIYVLEEDAGGRFQIDATTGVVSVSESGLFSSSDISQHAITVRATSNDTSWATQGFLIQVQASEVQVNPPLDSETPSGDHESDGIQGQVQDETLSFVGRLRGNATALTSLAGTLDSNMPTESESIVVDSARTGSGSPQEMVAESSQRQAENQLFSNAQISALQARSQVSLARNTFSFTVLPESVEASSRTYQQAASSEFYTSLSQNSSVFWNVPSDVARQTALASQHADKILTQLLDANTYLTDQSVIWHQLDTLAYQMHRDETELTLAVGSIASVSTTLSAGYVIWMLRSGQLVTSLAVQLPSWKLIDPLPIFDQLDVKQAAAIEEDSLADIIESSNAFLPQQTSQ